MNIAIIFAGVWLAVEAALQGKKLIAGMIWGLDEDLETGFILPALRFLVYGLGAIFILLPLLF
jgi:hypothetical protein